MLLLYFLGLCVVCILARLALGLERRDPCFDQRLRRRTLLAPLEFLEPAHVGHGGESFLQRIDRRRQQLLCVQLALATLTLCLAREACGTLLWAAKLALRPLLGRVYAICAIDRHAHAFGQFVQLIFLAFAERLPSETGRALNLVVLCHRCIPVV